MFVLHVFLNTKRLLHTYLLINDEIVVSSIQKGTKNALETGRTFATLFADMDLRLRLLVARTEGEFKRLMWDHMKELAEEQSDGHSRRKLSRDSNEEKGEEVLPRVQKPPSSIQQHAPHCTLDTAPILTFYLGLLSVPLSLRYCHHHLRRRYQYQQQQHFIC